jgi:hypothetical protein
MDRSTLRHHARPGAGTSGSVVVCTGYGISRACVCIPLSGHRARRKCALCRGCRPCHRSAASWISLEAGTQPEQVELTIRQALERGLTTPRRLRAAVADRPDRARRFIERILTETTA